MEERLQKIMSHAGLGSRRACEELIIDGRVTVNGKLAVIGQKADPASDRIVADGRVISEAEAPIYIALYKPRNVLSTVEAESQDYRKTVRDLVPVEGRIYPVGRLDFDSEGLVLMTNDGDLANKLTHPKYGHLKIYRVLVARKPDNEHLATWRRGVVLADGYKTAPADVTLEGSAGKGAWLRVVMREGRKRQIREIGSLLGLPVVRILRISIGPLRLGMLKRGEWRHLSEEEVAELKGEGPSKKPRQSSPRSQDRPQRTRRPGMVGARTETAASRRNPRPGQRESGARPERPTRPASEDRSGKGPRRNPRPDQRESGARPERPTRPAPGDRSGKGPRRNPRPDQRESGARPERPTRPAPGDRSEKRPRRSPRPAEGDAGPRPAARPARPRPKPQGGNSRTPKSTPNRRSRK